jgi:hypothetical protein
MPCASASSPADLAAVATYRTSLRQAATGLSASSACLQALDASDKALYDATTQFAQLTARSQQQPTGSSSGDSVARALSSAAGAHDLLACYSPALRAEFAHGPLK